MKGHQLAIGIAAAPWRSWRLRPSCRRGRPARRATPPPFQARTSGPSCNIARSCHGVSAQGFLGYYPIPRLAGQQVAYIQNQLQGFSEHKRTNNIMFNVGHVLSPAMIAALANSFHDLDPKPLANAPKELVAAGKQIYEEGVAGANVPACASCHGKEAKGTGQFPRLAGQLYAYVSLQLTNWSKERRRGHLRHYGADRARPDRRRKSRRSPLM